MRRLVPLLAGPALALGAVAAHAGALPFSGRLTITTFAGNAASTPSALVPLPPIGVSGSGIATVGGPHIDTLQVPSSPFSGMTAIALPISLAPPHLGLALTVHNGAGSFVGGTGMGLLGGQMLLNGVMKICVGSECESVTTPPPANLNVPLDPVGAGGTTFSSTLVNVTAMGAPWTVGTAAVGTVSIAGFHHGPGSLTSSTAQASGSIRLVTPVFVSTNIGVDSVLPTFGILELRFVPEPATALLLAAGIAGLVGFGRTRRR